VNRFAKVFELSQFKLNSGLFEDAADQFFGGQDWCSFAGDGNLSVRYFSAASRTNQANDTFFCCAIFWRVS
jgi:hypothetical protein